ncbi:hypothetical protein CLU79DRAFT_734939 [Phycomyces nitens]|nr:hypothetical protein CLU79DRAFT_734939 [Phycomyces nitens]
MSRLPSAMPVSSGIPPPKSKLARQPSMDFRKKKQAEHPPTVKPTRSTRTPSISRASLSSYASQEDSDSPSLSRYSMSSVGSVLTAMTSPRSSLTSPKPNTRRPLSVRPVCESPTPAGFRVGDRVAVDSMSIVGTLKFLGTAHFKEGLWAGIQLDIVGTGKNDGSVGGARYFQCPPNTGLFVLASKVAPLDRDSDSVRSLSPPSPQQHRSSVSQISAGSRAARYIGLTATQLTQSQSSSHRPTRTPQAAVPLQRNKSYSMVSPPPQQPQSQPQHQTQRRSTIGIPSPATTPTSTSVHDDEDTHDGLLLEEEHMLTDTPIPANLALSKSTDPTVETESAHARLERVLGEAIQQAPDETVIQLQRLQLRVEVLEAENKFLKLENAQNKTAQQILERSLLLRKKDGEDESYFTLEGHKAVVQEIRDEHATAIAGWETKSTDWNQVRSGLETRITALEKEQSELVQERDRLAEQLSESKRQTHQMEHRVHELEQQVAVAEANAAASQASRTANTTTSFYSQDPEELRERQTQMEVEMEEVHEKMGSLMDAMRAKDLFLGKLSEQVEIHRNMIEEKEREVRRVKADTDRHQREKERYREEADELEKKLLEHQDCATKEQFDKIKRDLGLARDNLAKENLAVDDYRKRIEGLETSVDELKKTCMESIELYESSVELHKVDMEAINASLTDERRKVSDLEAEREDLRKAGLDAIEAYETTIEELKKEHNTGREDEASQRKDMQTTITKLKQEIEQLVNSSSNPAEQVETIKDVWDSERRRLEDQLALSLDQLSRERDSQAGLKQETEGLREQIKEAEKIAKEKAKLEDQVGRLQADYDAQLVARNKYLEDIRTSVESQKKTEGELRRLTEAKEKTERDLASAQAMLQRTEASLAELRQGPVDTEAMLKERQQHAKDMDTLRSEIERLEAQNGMLAKQKEEAEHAAKQKEARGDGEEWKKQADKLKIENARLASECDKISEAHKQVENECLKLMEEVEKLHAESAIFSQPEDGSGENDGEEKVRKLQTQLLESKRQLDRQQAAHTAELAQVQEAQRKEHDRNTAALHRDISELESLIESKIFKEADLEEVLEHERKQTSRLRDELSDIKDQVKRLLRERDQQQQQQRPLSLTEPKASHLRNSSIDTTSGLYCEICEVAGHDLMGCKAVVPEAVKTTSSKQLYCENCDEHGLHDTDHCPNQNETF